MPRHMSTFTLILAGIFLGAAPSGEIAYIQEEAPGTGRLMVLNATTSAPRALGRGQGDAAPAWSPDGKLVAFESQQGAGRGIFLADAETGAITPLPHGLPLNRDPVWAPEGGRLAYSSTDGTPENQQIRVYDTATSEEARMGAAFPGAGPDMPAPVLMAPAWLPEDSLLVGALKARLEEVGGDIERTWAAIDPPPGHTLLAIGLVRGQRRLSTDIFVVTPEFALPLPPVVMPSEDPYEEWAIAVHPKGRLIAFESNDGGDREVFVVSHKGAFDLSNHRAADWSPVWSPGGDRLAFESFRKGRCGIYTVNPETALVFTVAAGEADCYAPSWSPDGEWLAYVSDATGQPGIYICTRDGKEKTRLTEEESLCHSPAWRPGDAE